MEIYAVVGAFSIALLAMVWRAHRGELVGAMEVPTKRTSFTVPRKVTVAVRRIASGGTPRPVLVFRICSRLHWGYRVVSLRGEDAMRWMRLLEKCAADGRVADDASAVRLAVVEIGPDYDLEEGHVVGLSLVYSYPEIRLLLTPAQAATLASWMRIALAPGERLAQARRNARAEPERQRAA